MKQEKDFEDLGYAKVDYGREKRQGQPEVIYAAAKTKEQVCVLNYEDEVLRE